MGIASMATGLFDAFGQQDAQRKQEKAYNDWMAEQDKNRAEENIKQDAFHKQAEAARVQGVNKLSMGSQAAQQVKEEARLTDYLQNSNQLTQDFTGNAATDTLTGSAGGDTVSVADQNLLKPYMMTGQGDVATGDTQFMSDLAGKLSQAAGKASTRMGQMATLGSMGGSTGGLDQFSDKALLDAGYTIEEINNLRNGSMTVYGIKQKKDPLHYTYQSGLRL
jgi:hypothetical protein